MTEAQATRFFEVLPDIRLVVSYQSRTPPTDPDWDTYLEAVQATLDPSKRFRFLVVTEGGHPSRAQQTRLIDVVRGYKLRVSVISPSPVLRFVVSVFALTNPDINCYFPSQRNEAFRHIGLDSKQQAIAEDALARLRLRITAQANPAVNTR